ncbi:hypothetical protein BCR44DRAFT_1005700 [Catenaria anguillulae PL171]|uniref:Uncharacterized protein n=1 Tax=Catenaria anguillulae PL171 TaxID=765915 RepID=A0A1Y2I3E2_9FUNG|nr:hypothetical protein BCR44DRAFT_1005700 [Catenaria anguillulae PL171]
MGSDIFIAMLFQMGVHERSMLLCGHFQCLSISEFIVLVLDSQLQHSPRLTLQLPNPPSSLAHLPSSSRSCSSSRHALSSHTTASNANASLPANTFASFRNTLLTSTLSIRPARTSRQAAGASFDPHPTDPPSATQTKTISQRHLFCITPSISRLLRFPEPSTTQMSRPCRQPRPLHGMAVSRTTTMLMQSRGIRAC